LAEEELKGQIGTISPAIKDKKVEFDVYLEESNHWKLRPNMTLPLKVVIDRSDSVMRIPFGEALHKGSNMVAYRVEGSVAVRQQIRTGLHGDNYLEIHAGVAPGDRLIISDVSLFRNKEQVDIY
jgi:HlyD family secretion protein